MSAEHENANELVFVSNASQMKLARSMDVEAPSTEYLRNLPECVADYSICQGMIADCLMSDFDQSLRFAIHRLWCMRMNICKWSGVVII